MSNIHEIKAPDRLTLKKYLEGVLNKNSEADLNSEIVNAITICKTPDGYAYFINAEEHAMALMGCIQHVLFVLNAQYDAYGYEEEEGV